VKPPNNSSVPVLDASAVLAVLFDEPGKDAVLDVGPRFRISVVNAAEVLAKLVRDGMPVEAATEALDSLYPELAPFVMGEALESARLATVKGLSLGDRACLATALVLRVAALTADRQWKNLPSGYRVTLIR